MQQKKIFYVGWKSCRRAVNTMGLASPPAAFIMSLAGPSFTAYRNYESFYLAGLLFIVRPHTNVGACTIGVVAIPVVW